MLHLSHMLGFESSCTWKSGDDNNDDLVTVENHYCAPINVPWM